MFRKTIYSLFLASTLMLSSCGNGGGLLGNIFGMGTPTTTNTTGNVLGSVLGSVLGGMANSGGGLLGGIFGNALTDNTATSLTNMVIGNVRLNQNELVGTWLYVQPGCAFTSQNLLANAGGQAAATQIKSKLSPAYQTIGFSSNNTGFAFDQNGNFEAYLKGLPLNGTYTFDPASGKLNLKTKVGTIASFVTRTANGLSITMETKMLQSLIQALGNMSGNSSIGNLASQYNGARRGFDFVKYTK